MSVVEKVAEPGNRDDKSLYGLLFGEHAEASEDSS